MKQFIAAFLLVAFASPVLADSTHDTSVGDITNNNTANGGSVSGVTASSSQEQGQTAIGEVGQNVEVKGDKYKAATSSSATLVLGTCQAGASAQTFQAGASIGSPDEVCLLFTASQLALTQNNPHLAADLLDRAVTVLKWRANPVRRAFQALPLLGRLF
jgi:hypothetical protein